LDTALALIGAVDYFLLFPSQNIARLIRVIERNENIFTAGGFRVDVQSRTAEYEGKPLDLSNVEFQVLTAMVQAYNGHRRVTYQALALAIYQEELDEVAAIKRLKTHLHNLRQKLLAAVGNQPIKTRKGIVYWVKPR
jgi:DNA-binding response OmpR family regulator